MIGKLPQRQDDAFGSGAYLAPRGSRQHMGIDLACYPGTLICSHVSGRVTKLGYPYSDNPRTEYNEMNYRYVQVTDVLRNAHRFFYVEPLVALGDEVTTGMVIGKAQDLQEVYPGITNHVHYEVKHEGTHLDPRQFL